MGQSISDERESLHDRAQRLEYDSLPTPTSIRVVKLESIDDEDHISLSMHVVDLNDTVDYDCLSYTWGRPCTVFKTQDDRDALQEIENPILVNGAITTIGRNAFDFLKAWRQRRRWFMRNIRLALEELDGHDTYRVPEVLWIDAICIDQNNVAERSAQVAQMARIFRQARRVVLWLGPEDDFSKPAFEVIKQIAYRDDGEAVNLPPVWSSAWFNIFALLQRSWFSRAWVVQEVIVAQELVMQVGTFAFPWENFVHSANVLYRRNLVDPIYAYASAEVHATKFFGGIEEDSARTGEPLAAWGQTCQLFSGTCEEDPSERIQGVEFVLLLHDLREKRTFKTIDGHVGEHSDFLDTDRSFLFLLQYMQRTECTDAKDRVYAFIDLLGRATRPVGEPSPLRRDIVPNYNLTLAEVYKDVAWHAILSGGNLDLLSFASGSTNELEGLPSWAPDWRNRATSAASVLSGQPHNVTVSATPCPIWELSQSSSVYGRYLHVEGNLFATVSEVSLDIISADNKAPYILGPAAQFLTQMLLPTCNCTTRLSTAHLLWKILTLNHSDMNCCTDHIIRTFSQIWRSEAKRAMREFEEKGQTSGADTVSILDTYAKGPHSLFPGLDTEGILEAEDTDLEETASTTFQPERFSEIMGTLSQIQMAPQDDLPGDVLYLKLRMEQEVEKMMLAYVAAPKPSMCTHRNTGRYDAKLKISNDVMFPWSRHYIQLRKLSKRMRLFKTDGQYVGNGPRAIQSGDQVWILSGARVPIILRPTNEGRRKVVGEAYIHGMMFGGATRHPNYQTKRIVLE